MAAALLIRAAHDADLVIVEGAMRWFDAEPNAAKLAERFGIPVLP